MPKFRLTYGTNDEFYAQTAGEVVPILQDRHMLGGSDDEWNFCRRLAIEMCEWNGGNYYYQYMQTNGNWSVSSRAFAIYLTAEVFG